MDERKTILLVEDDDSVRRLVRLSLERHDFDVVEASGGREGLEMLERHRPDAVILDLMMPDVGGEDVLTSLRRTPETERTPVVVMSGRHELGSEVVGLVGRQNVVLKPFDPEALVERVRAALG